MTTQTSVSPSLAETARKSYSCILQALQEPGMQVAIAARMGVSESTVSRLKTEHAEQFCLFLACLNKRIEDADRVSVNPKAFEFASDVLCWATQKPERIQDFLSEIGGN